MRNSQLQQSLRRASKELSIDIEIPFILDLPCGRIEAEALVKHFKYECGIVINVNFTELGDLYKHLADFGYGAITLLAPTCDGEYDTVKWMKLCKEWGWTGKKDPPDWY